MSGEVWKIEKDLCRCCHSEGSFDDLDFFPSSRDGEDVMCNMLRNDLGITITPIEGELSTQTYKICEICKLRLLDATNFKRQVILCEERFKDMYSRELIQGLTSQIEVKIEPADDFYMPEDMDTTGADDSANMSEEEFKMETNEEDDVSDKVGKLKQLFEKKGGGRLRELLEIDVPAAAPEKPKGKPKPKPKPKSKPKATKAKAKTKKVSTKEGDEREPPSSGETEKEDKADREKTAKVALQRFFMREKDYNKDGDTYNCTKCEHKTTSFVGMHNHVKNKHYLIPKYKCSCCGKGFNAESTLVNHKLKDHEVDERHKCKACQGVFTTGQQLKNHMRGYHMLGEKYKCDLCEYETHLKQRLSRHQLRHSKVKNLKCKFCKKTFARDSNLRYHERIHTGDKRKVCEVCGQAFVQKASLNYHMTKYHPEVNF